MITVTELKRWLSELPADESVYIDEGGLTLRAYRTSSYYEVGGNPDEDAAEVICPTCETAGSMPVLLPHTADATCNVCGADWPKPSDT